MVRLVINPGSAAEREVRLEPGRYSLGRGFANDFSIDDPSVSGTHCQIEVAGDSIFITDLGSTNGTFIDGNPVKQAQLLAGQTIRLGSVPMQLRAENPGVALEMPVAVATPAPQRPPPLHTPALPASFSGASGGQCKHHPKTPGRFVCPQCHHFYCELCVSSRHNGPVIHKSCRHCGVDCLPVQVRLTRPVEKGFFQRLPEAFLYPFRGAGVVIVIVGMVIMAGLKFGGMMMGFGSLRMLVFGIILQIFAGGYLFSFLQGIIHATAAEDKELPDLPGFGNFLDDILMPFLRLLGLSLVCFAPTILVGIVLAATGWTAGAPLLFGTMILGAVYFPMAFLAVAVLDSVFSANPLVIVPSIVKVPLEYLVTLITLGAVFGFRTLGDRLVRLMFPDGFSTKDMPTLFAMLGSHAFWGFVSLYLLIVGTHILGLLYVTRKEKLGWLQH